MLTVHHLNNSRSQRILWLLEELKLPYEIKRYARDPVTIRAPKELKKIHPLGKSPVLSEGDIVVAESGAIVQYLIDTHDSGQSLAPSGGAQAKRDEIYWMHFAEGSLMPPLLMALLFEKVKESPMPFFVKPVARGIADKVMGQFVQPEINNLLAFVEQHIANREWFAGEGLTGADFQMSFPLEALVAKEKVTSETHPGICAFVKRIQSRDAYLAALEKGGDYDYGPK